MSASNQRSSSLTLTLRLCAVLVVGAVLLSLLVTMAAAEGARERRIAELHRHQRDMCVSLARRAAPLLERGDDLRLSVLAASAADLTDGRVVMVDRQGRVRLDTGLALGGQKVEIETTDGPRQRATGDSDLGWEVLAAALGSDGFAGEVRIRYRIAAALDAPFPWSLFGLVFLCSVSLVTLAGWIAHSWVQRIRSLTRQAQRAARGEPEAAERRDLGAGAVGELEHAVRELTAASEGAARRAREGYLRLAREVVHALEVRGHVPAGHPERTRRLALDLASEIGMRETERAEVAEAALLLDLGKAGVRPTALTKASGLDDVERESLRQHPVRGAMLVAALPELENVAAAIRHQHEKWDGGGFPDALRGDRIPLQSRIVAIAAAYDLMIAGSNYGRPMSWPDALDRLREDRGEHFDPDLVDAFERIIRRSAPKAAVEDRVMISTGGVVPYRAVHGDARQEQPVFEDDAVDEILACSDEELEVVFEDGVEEPGR